MAVKDAVAKRLVRWTGSRGPSSTLGQVNVLYKGVTF